MSCITTVTGKHFDPMRPVEQEIEMEDIAHALSLICRGNGHTKFFYSVAQHCLACAEEAMERDCTQAVILGCLLHDASEAYLSDVTRPVKKDLPQYLLAEKNLQRAIWRRFIGRDLTPAEQRQIRAIDDQMLSMEFHQLMPEELNDAYTRLLTDVNCRCQSPQEVEAQLIRVRRILQYETHMQEAARLLHNGKDADRLEGLISGLASYYNSAAWKQDFAADEAGLLPTRLKRGVLSEDGVYDLLEAYAKRT